MLSIDAHAHVFHRSLPLAPDRRYAPGYDAPLDAYLAELDRAGISHGVLVQPSFLGTDNRYLVDCLKAANGRLRGIAVVDPATSAEELQALDRAGVAGLRLNLLGRPLPDLGEPSWQRLLTAARDLGWQVEVQRRAGDLADLAARLLDHDVAVVLDHFALPDPTLGITDPGFAAVLELGRSGRVWIKLSAPYRNRPQGRRFAHDAYPLLRTAFGPARMMWGSDWPHTQFETTQDYAGSRSFLDELIQDAAERSDVLAAPKALFRF
jgi:predicted TIM-barrel fold metal-dependent hydrolase